MRNRRIHRMGQVFLVNAHIAEIEAEHGRGKNVVEIGPGPGMLTRQLLKMAKHIVAVEKDKTLYNSLKAKFRSKKIKLIHNDFFDVNDEELGLKDIDIMISNVPYSLSSKTIEWLASRRMQAVLCLQKEFVNHMLATEDTDDYSSLSVVTALSFRVTKILDVSRGNFRPIPLVDSAIIYIKPLENDLSKDDLSVLRALMQHKKKTVRNAMVDSSSSFDIDKSRMALAMEKIERKGQRVFKLSPKELLDIAREIIAQLNAGTSRQPPGSP